MGLEGDEAGLPRILLYAQGSASFLQSVGALQLDCQRQNGRIIREVYISWNERLSIPRPYGYDEPDRRVEYSVDGADRAGRTWNAEQYEGGSYAVFAPVTQARDIINALKRGATRLEFKVYTSTGTDSHTYRFSTAGFTKAFEPLDSICG